MNKAVQDGIITADSPTPTTENATKTKKSVDSRTLTLRIAYLATLIAINVAIGAVSPRLGSLKLTLTYTMCFLAGFYFGPLSGALVGGIGDLLGCLISGFSPNPIILLCSCLLGLIPGLVSFLKLPQIKDTPVVHIIVSYVAVFIICTLFLNSYALYVMGLAKGATYWAYLGIRAISQSPIVAINLAITLVLAPIFALVYKNTVRLKKRV